jgi:hypothetical protein
MFRRAVRQWLVVAWVAFISLPLHAQVRFESPGGMWVQQGGERGERQERRDYRNDRGRSRDDAQRPHYDRRGSMTPDERRELNRDLQRANREFYRKGRERQ